jgi:3-deoxy-D-manno-octulosonic-acid transferase
MGGGLSRPGRPRGDLIWAHAADPDAVPALIQLAVRLRAARPDVSILLTLPQGEPSPDALPTYVLTAPIPEDNRAQSQAFLAHWQPDLCIWHTGHLRPTLITALSRRDVPMILVDAVDHAFEEPRFRWSKRADKSALGGFQAVFARTANAARKLTRLGVDPEILEVTGPLQEAGPALMCNEDERQDMAESLAGRPIWTAAYVQDKEIPLIIEAHRIAMRAAHRLMLILVPADPAQGPSIADRLRDEGFRIADWALGDFPQDTTQILLADSLDDMGLWYRLAPISFLGSSLISGRGGCDPFEPATLGSAILYGPNVSRHMGAYARLSRVGAARVVRDAATLGAMVTRLGAPDQAAAMAQSAWDVATSGAEVTDRVLDLVQDMLDMRGGIDANT